MNGIRKSYADTEYGQLHVRCIEASAEETKPPLLCLHPAPSSGLYFETILPMLNAGRRVIAPDYPGYGGSDPVTEPVSIADYAKAMLEVLDQMGLSGPVDVLGFHTGCLVAVELVQAAPTRFRRIVLCDVPFFSSSQQETMRAEMTKPMPVTGELDSLTDVWKFNVASRIDDVPLARAFELFAEHLRAGTNDWFAFDAAFRYDCEARFSTVSGDITCLATQSGLREPTIVASKTIHGARFVDVTEVIIAVFEAGAAAISRRIQSELERQDE